MARVVVTANAIRSSGRAAVQPIVDAGAEVAHVPRMGPLTEPEALAAARDADVLLASSDAYTRSVLNQCPRLRGIVRYGVGVDSIDLAAATELGIVVVNAPGSNSQAVADHTFAMLLAVARRIPAGAASVRAGEWTQVQGVDVWEKTLGIIGLGAIGRAVARRARGFAMRILAHDPFAPGEAFAGAAAEPVSLDRLLAESHFVTLHCSLGPETRRLIDAAALRRMRPDAYLVNCARGALVDEAALAQALEEGRIGGAALDAFEEEPLPAGHPFRTLPNCLATAHNAWNTRETLERTNRIVVDAVLSLLRGERPPGVVNPAVYEGGSLRAERDLLGAPG